MIVGAFAQEVRVLHTGNDSLAPAGDLGEITEHLARRALILIFWTVLFFEDLGHAHGPRGLTVAELAIGHLLQAID
jgi:hypothetical protein